MKLFLVLACLLFAGCLGETNAGDDPDSVGPAEVDVGDDFRPASDAECPAPVVLVEWTESMQGGVKAGSIGFEVPANGTVLVSSHVGTNAGDSTWALAVITEDETEWSFENGGGAASIGENNNMHPPTPLSLATGVYAFTYEIQGFIDDIGTVVSFESCA